MRLLVVAPPVVEVVLIVVSQTLDKIGGNSEIDHNLCTTCLWCEIETHGMRVLAVKLVHIPNMPSVW